MEKILIAGATGFVGKHLTQYLIGKGYCIHVLTRNGMSQDTQNLYYFKWDIENKFIEGKAFEGVTQIINLTGANIGEKRWTKARKKEILNSRIKSLDLLFHYVKMNQYPVQRIISSSAVGYYGTETTPHIFTEEDENGNDFLGQVCKQWENAALQFESIGIQTVILRKGVIIGHDGGMYQKLAPLAKWGINTAVGNGKQYLPWMDIRDLERLYSYILQKDDITGIYNATASQHITMNHFATALSASFGRKNMTPNIPAFLVRLVLGEMSVMLLEGSRVSNDKIRQSGFRFQWDVIEKSLV